MNSAIDVHRLQFAFTVTFHYFFPQLTMGLALLIVVLKSLPLVKQDGIHNVTTVLASEIMSYGLVRAPGYPHDAAEEPR